MRTTETTSSEYTSGEELANSITHGVATGMSIAALVVLIVTAMSQGTTWHVVSFSIFGPSACIFRIERTCFLVSGWKMALMMSAKMMMTTPKLAMTE